MRGLPDCAFLTVSRAREGQAGSMTPLVEEIAYRDPFAAFLAFSGHDNLVFLDSALAVPRLGRYTFIAAEPFRVLKSKNGATTLDGRAQAGNPWDVLGGELRRYPSGTLAGVPPFQGGAAGYFGYELARHLERVPAAASDDQGFPDLALGFYDAVIAFDQEARRGFIVSSGHPETEPAARTARAKDRAAGMMRRLETAPETAPPPPAVPRRAEVGSNFTRPGYEATVQAVIDYIYAGDISQANLSQRFRSLLPRGLTPLALYHRLRGFNPAPFAAYLAFGEVVVASSSPERFLRLERGRVETRPIKGTRPRGPNPMADSALAQALLASEKDRAENVMIVDLLRNDLSRVCQDGSVEVPELCIAESYATVFHLVSTVLGRLAPGLDAVDLLRASFPGGSITGAPKIRAMEIIAELEPHRRGPYCGSIGYIGFDGTLDSNIVIRSYALQGEQIAFNAGGGIVADSRPAEEYEETLAKAGALVMALSPEA